MLGKSKFRIAQNNKQEIELLYVSLSKWDNNMFIVSAVW